MKRIALCIAPICCAVAIITPLHSGKTDGNGGHYDHSTGEYHYHHGYPAHQHPNGVCPYDAQEYNCGKEGCGISGPHGHINKPTTTTTEKTQKQENDRISLSDNDKGFFESFSTFDKILCCLCILFLPGLVGICFEKLKAFISRLRK